MAKKQLIDAVEARLGANWDGIPVFLQSAGEDLPKGGIPFLLLQFPFAEAARMAMNAGIYREEGGFRIVLNEPRGSGLDKGLERCEALATLFRDQKFGGVICQVPSSPLIDDDTEDGSYVQFSMVVPYTLNF